jgi:hypothetical protein
MNNYQPVQPAKTPRTLLLAQVAPGESGIVGFIGNPIREESAAQVPPEFRAGIIAALAAWKLVAESDMEECLPRLGYSDEAGINQDSIRAESTIKLINDSLAHFRRIWPYEAMLADLSIPNLESALMCLAKQPANQDVDAFCPEGSRGFMRHVLAQGLDNPSAPVVEKVPESFPELLEALFGSKYPGHAQMGRQKQIKEIEFPEP